VPWEPLPSRDGTAPDPVEVGRVLQRLTASLGGPAPSTMVAVFGRWSDLVGPVVAAHARPRALTGGTLVVEVDEPGWATQLRFLEGDLLGRIGEVAPGEVQRIEVRVTGPGRPIRRP
jgi:predicted nucleic acid-binding Zn ribbon protein